MLVLSLLLVSILATCLGSENGTRPMRILVLFSGSSDEGLNIDHRLGRQIVKLAAERAQQIHPELGRIQLTVYHDDTGCSRMQSSIPDRVAELYYGTGGCERSPTSCSLAAQQEVPEDNGSIDDRSAQTESAGWSAAFDAIIGPICDHLVDSIARMAAYWRTPIYSMGSVSGQFSRKQVYTSLTRLSPSIEHMSMFMIRTMEHFRWRHLAILTDASSSTNRMQLDDLERTIARWRLLIPIERRLFTLDANQLRLVQLNGTGSDPCTGSVRETLKLARRVARVFLLLLADGGSLRQTLLCAHQLGMNNGEFTFLASDLGLRRPDSAGSEPHKVRNLIDWFSDSDESNNPVAREMFESLMVFSIELPVGDEFELFAEQALELANREYPDSRFGHQHLDSAAVGLHDSLMMAAEAQALALASGDPVATRPALLWNRHLSQGLLAGVQINANGDQELDYLLCDLEPELGVMRPVARYAKELRQVHMLPNSYVHWPRRLGSALASGSGRRQIIDNDEPPPDEPECGFTGEAEQCIDRQNMQAALILLALLLGFSLFVAFYIVHRSRQIQYKLQLDDHWWKIELAQLQFIQHGDSVSSKPQSIARALSSAASVISASSNNGFITVHRETHRKNSSATGLEAPSLAPSDFKRLKHRPAVPLIVTPPDNQSDHKSGTTVSDKYSALSGFRKGAANTCLIRSEFSSVVRVSNLAMYKNELVIVKQLNSSAIKVTHDLLVELHSIRELIHENLARFVGLCTDQEHPAIVYEFCSRGSLQDMLLNKSVVMDWTLKYSILGDIISGLNFIHTTKLDYHGRLKSTNLVIDGRFTVKITDFGLQTLYAQLEPIEDCHSDKGDDDEEEEEEETVEENKQVDEFGSVTDTYKRKSEQKNRSDQLSLAGTSQAFNMESVSMRSAPQRNRRTRSNAVSVDGHLRFRNKGAARYFWTAPEHLRSDQVHNTGSKRGDIYSLAIIMFELFTRQAPYHYGTNAKPNWSKIKADRQVAQNANQPDAGGNRQSTTPATSVAVTSIGRQTRRAQQRARRSMASVEPLESRVDSSSLCSGSTGVSGRKARQSVVTIEEQSEPGDQQSTEGAQAKPSEPLEEKQTEEEILDQLRMGVQPEPVRPYVPNYILQDVDSRLVELMRSCWAESAQLRPNLNQIRSQLRHITKGLTSKNYLDNLLERLQNYAAELERVVDMKGAEVVEEKARTEEILFQLMPRFVADRLKRDEPIVPRLFEGVTIFFSDIVGFETYAALMSPKDLVNLLNCIYSSFDSIISSFDVTKIETIIDQFLVAAGISAFLEEPATVADKQPAPVSTQEPEGVRKARKRRPRLSRDRSMQDNSNSFNESLEQAELVETGSSNQYRQGCAEQIARMALCIRDLVRSGPFKQNMAGIASSFNIRIGIHSGKVCAGIVGLKRPKFCLIGDTVNVASRMHTNSKANRIQISASTKQLIESMPGFNIEPRGRIEVKGKGVMETYWLDSSY